MPLKPGVSGNPSGRRKLTEQDRLDIAYLRRHATDACRRLVKLIGDDDPKVAIAASREVLDRAWGKPIQQTETYVEIDSRVAMRAEIRAALLAEADGTLIAYASDDDAAGLPAIDAPDAPECTD